MGERSRTGHPGTELIAGEGTKNSLISRWDGDGGRNEGGEGWVWGTDDGTKCDGDSSSSSTLSERLGGSALRTALHCTVTAGQHEWGGWEGAAMSPSPSLASQAGVAQSAVAMAAMAS